MENLTNKEIYQLYNAIFERIEKIKQGAEAEENEMELLKSAEMKLSSMLTKGE